MIRRHKSLVVDDEVDAREELKAACAGLGHDVVVAATVEEAASLLATQRFCYMVVDNVLPLREGMTPWARAGTNLLRDTRERFTWKQLPVIVVTGRGAPEDVTAAFKAGSNDFALKPFDKAKDEPLDAKIRSALAFGCLSRRCCPHHGGDEDDPTTGERVYSARHQLHFVGDLKKGRVLIEVDEDPYWVQRNTFDALWRLRVEDARSRDDGWVHGSKLAPLQTNFSLSINRAVADLEALKIGDLVEWDKGRARVRLCTPPDRVSHDPRAMRDDHEELLKLLE